MIATSKIDFSDLNETDIDLFLAFTTASASLKNTLETSGEDGESTLETSGEDEAAITLRTSLASSGALAMLLSSEHHLFHSKRVEKIVKKVTKNTLDGLLLILSFQDSRLSALQHRVGVVVQKLGDFDGKVGHLLHSFRVYSV